MTRVGLISDTHGKLDSHVFEIFEGVERILHAGDVGAPDILSELSSLAPVTAVAGNMDIFPLTEQLNEVEVVTLTGTCFLLLHQVGRPENPDVAVRRLLGEHQPNLVVFGHTHVPYDAVVEGVRYLNPGGAGPRRFNLPRTVALLELTPTGVEVQFVDLETRQPLILGGVE